jgi:hypothetical protein
MGGMSSWRDSASEAVQGDLDGLLNATLPFAEQMLGKNGEFFPFGASVTVDGGVSMAAGDPGEGEHPRSDDVLATLLEGFRGRREALRAVAFVADVRVDGGDAIRVELEHRDGHALAVLLPYKKKQFGKGIEYGTLEAGTAARQVWADRI